MVRPATTYTHTLEQRAGHWVVRLFLIDSNGSLWYHTAQLIPRWMCVIHE